MPHHPTMAKRQRELYVVMYCYLFSSLMDLSIQGEYILGRKRKRSSNGGGDGDAEKKISIKSHLCKVVFEQHLLLPPLAGTFLCFLFFFFILYCCIELVWHYGGRPECPAVWQYPVFDDAAPLDRLCNEYCILRGDHFGMP